jgi:hypothetical protein
MRRIGDSVRWISRGLGVNEVGVGLRCALVPFRVNPTYGVACGLMQTY